MSREHPRTLKSLPVLMLLLVMACLHKAHSQSAPSPNEISGYLGLHSAAHTGDMDAATELLQNSADLEARDGSGRTPLHVAAFASHDDMVALLTEAGADMNALESRAYDVVTIAAVANDVDMLNLALDLGASAGNITSPYDGTALIAAAHLGHFEVVDSLIKHDAPLDHVNNLNWTAVIEAIVLGDGGENHTKTLELLLRAGADKTIADGQGVTPLQHAQSRGYQAMIDLIMDGPD